MCTLSKLAYSARHEPTERKINWIFWNIRVITTEKLATLIHCAMKRPRRPIAKDRQAVRSRE